MMLYDTRTINSVFRFVFVVLLFTRFYCFVLYLSVATADSARAVVPCCVLFFAFRDVFRDRVVNAPPYVRAVVLLVHSSVTVAVHIRTSSWIYSSSDENSTDFILVPALRHGRYGRHRGEVGMAHIFSGEDHIPWVELRVCGAVFAVEVEVEVEADRHLGVGCNRRLLLLWVLREETKKGIDHDRNLV